MSEQELMFEYINVKVNYRHQKNIWILSIVLSVLLILQICKSCTDFINQVRTVASYQENPEVLLKIGFSIAGILAIAVIILIIIFALLIYKVVKGII